MRARTIGAAPRTAGHSRLTASQSSGVMVMTLPDPKLTPPLEAVPGKIIMLSAPMLATVFWMALLEPWPISIIAITAPTPMTMPRVVSTARITLRRSARSAVLSVRNTLIEHLR